VYPAGARFGFCGGQVSYDTGYPADSRYCTLDQIKLQYTGVTAQVSAAVRLRKIRNVYGWAARELAERCSGAGYPALPRLLHTHIPYMIQFSWHRTLPGRVCIWHTSRGPCDRGVMYRRAARLGWSPGPERTCGVNLSERRPGIRSPVDNATVGAGRLAGRTGAPRRYRYAVDGTMK
jgi:hypothetical protein